MSRLPRGLTWRRPAMEVADDPDRHSLSGHSLPTHRVLPETSAALDAHASLDRDATYGGAFQTYAIPFPEQLGQVGVIGSRVPGAGGPDHSVAAADARTELCGCPLRLPWPRAAASSIRWGKSRLIWRSLTTGGSVCL